MPTTKLTALPLRLRPFRLLLLLMALGGQGSAAAALFSSAPEAWAYWDTAAAASTGTVDHSAWQATLDQYLISNSSDGINRFAYAAVDQQGRTRLQGYLQALQAMDPRQLNRAEQMAYWINLYNAGTVELILDNMPGLNSIRDIGSLFSPGAWDLERFQINGEALTLNDVEHRILRPIFKDRRVHFAVNCASLGCPNLAAQAFTAASLEAQLEQGAKAYINHPRGLRFDGKTLYLSSIFDWYRIDFPSDDQAFLDDLASHLPAQAAGKVRNHQGRIRYSYDWALNAP